MTILVSISLITLILVQLREIELLGNRIALIEKITSDISELQEEKEVGGRFTLEDGKDLFKYIELQGDKPLFLTR